METKVEFKTRITNIIDDYDGSANSAPHKILQYHKHINTLRIDLDTPEGELGLPTRNITIRSDRFLNQCEFIEAFKMRLKTLVEIGNEHGYNLKGMYLLDRDDFNGTDVLKYGRVVGYPCDDVEEFAKYYHQIENKMVGMLNMFKRIETREHGDGSEFFGYVYKGQEFVIAEMAELTN